MKLRVVSLLLFLWAVPLSAEVVWPVQFTLATEGIVYASAAADAEGNIYFGSHSGTFYSYTRMGALRWEFEGISDWIESTALLTPDGAVVFGSWNGTVYALDRQNGALRWQFATGSYVIASPALLPDGRILIGGGDGILYCLTPNGQVSWLYVNDTEIESSPAVDAQGNVFYGTMEGRLVSLTANGALRWSREATPVSGRLRSFQSSPALSVAGFLYIGSSNGNLYAIDTQNGALLWTFAAEDAVDSSPAIGLDGTVYFASRDGYLYAVDPAGFQLWETWVGDVFYSSPAIDAQGNVYIVGFVGNGISTLWQLSGAGAVVRSASFADVNDSSVLLSPTGELWVGMYNHRLYGLSGSMPTTQGWAQFRNSPARTGLLSLGSIWTPPHPDSAFALWQDSGGGWAWVDAWSSGWVFLESFPWCWHGEHGWSYVLGIVPGQAWIFDWEGGLGWVYWDAGAPDHYYWPEHAVWLRHRKGTSTSAGDRFFYDFPSSP